MFKLGSVLMIVLSLPIFYFMVTLATPMWVVITSSLIVLSYALIPSSFIFLLCDLFPTDVRLSGVGLSYNFAFAIVGGVAPLVSVAIISSTGFHFLGPALVGVVCGVIGLVGVAIYHKKGGYYKDNENLIVKL